MTNSAWQNFSIKGKFLQPITTQFAFWVVEGARQLPHALSSTNSN